MLDFQMSIKTSITRKLFQILLCTVLVAIVAWIPSSEPKASHNCYGSTCTGLNPQTLGCGSDALTGPFYNSSTVLVQNRYSIHCNAEWERTTNKAGAPRYAVGSIRYGCANYCYHKSVSSPSQIGDGQQIYTPMIGPDSTIPTLSCGGVSTIGPLQTPVTNPCTGVG